MKILVCLGSVKMAEAKAEDFHLKTSSIFYLDPKIIEQYAYVKLISIESKNYVWANPLCLAAISPVFSELEISEEDDFKIITEHSIKDLEQIVKFCHCGSFPTETLPYSNVFQVCLVNKIFLFQKMQ